ncbi:hypothetical protein SDC9_161405 [bioreactor metagenome]|uniref:Uncharacterized protein n=1 Tax=bioreactor metagenome TaxID=1076179 RepID=A0A645FL71_9ZZZZ
MRSLFTITERKRLYISPRYESAEKIEVYLSSEAKLTVIPKTNESEAGGDDEVYLITKLGNKSRVYYLSRYRVMSRLMEFVTQDAKYGTNEAVNRLPEGY